MEILPFSGVLPPVNLATSSAASLAAACACGPQPTTVSATPLAPTASAARRESCRIENPPGKTFGATAQGDHSGHRGQVQIIFNSENVRFTRQPAVAGFSARQRF